MNNTLTVGGLAELTAANRGAFQNQICAALQGQRDLEIDLSQTTYMDCAGLGALIALGKVARARDSALRLVNPTAPVRKLFDVVQAGQYFDIVSTTPTGEGRLPSEAAFVITSSLAPLDPPSLQA